ncbi:hypothetical protein BGX28_001583 [Mortierella sp. GBA30]|nr:hypothetical protein BGX28_001583 [Mortierella sp. GBA30]
MLIRYSEEARSEYIYLNLAFKFIVMLAPNCQENRTIRLESEMLKIVSTVEDIVVAALFTAGASSDEEKRFVLQEFSLSSGPRSVFPNMEPLTDHEWDLGRLYFLLKTLSVFDEFSPALQLQLYPTEGPSDRSSLFTRIVECASNMDLCEIMALRLQGIEQDNGDLYIRILSELCTFVHLVQPKQFARLQIDMMGLVIGQSEIWSLIAIDWWTCVSENLGQEFVKNQTTVLAQLLSSLPNGRASDKIGFLLASIIPLLNEQLQLQLASDLHTMITEAPSEDIHALLSCFPYHALDRPSLDFVIEKCVDGWRNACNLLSDEHIVLEAFYAMRQYVACLTSILAVENRRSALSDVLRMSLVSWSIDIIGGAHELVALVADNEQALLKIKMKDLLSNLYDILLKDEEWVLAHEGLQSLLLFVEYTRCPQLASGCIPANLQELIRQLQDPKDDIYSSPSENAKPFWNKLGLRAKAIESQSFKTKLLGELRPAPSLHECISSLSTATRLLEAMSSVASEDVAFRSRLTAEFARLQKLVDSLKSRLT